jgi:DNA-binding NtrC family response regulator
MEPMRTPPSFFLEVVGGVDHGARLMVEGTVRTIGRSHDSDLVLRDPSVSRSHAQVLALETGIQFAVCAGATPLVIDGRSVQSCDAKPGERITIGKTLLLIGTHADGAFAPEQVLAPTDARTLMTGMGADARLLAAVHDMIEALDRAHDRAALEQALRSWASTHVRATVVNVEERPRAGEHASEQETFEYTIEPADAGSIVTTHAGGESPLRLSFVCPGAANEVTDSIRRTLIVATRLYASAVARVVRMENADEEKSSLRALAIGSALTFLGESPAALEVTRLVGRLAASDVTVLLEGETGTGKTFLARLIHESGPRAKSPLRIINCAAIPETLVEAELFGHERGAFTGATSARAGVLEAAGAGTVLLDELGELPLSSQAKILRVLEEKRFERVGSNRSIPLEARVMAATNRDLQQMVDAGTFRGDLYYRIAVVKLRVPPLRDRGEDLVLLAEQMLSDLAVSTGRRLQGFSQAALDAIRRYPWPGNVRELRNAVERALVIGEGAWIEADDLPEFVTSVAPPQPSDASLVRLPANLEWLEQRAIEAALQATGGNQRRAALLLGINRVTLHRKLRGRTDGS